ncbi:MAG: amidohydrolase family protein [Ilumatobacteraceae bacterium]|nr:amidohydrolase family protein [Ilumatobacteraceae bacterium]
MTMEPLMISVDDHVMEDPEIWTSRAPASRKNDVPHVERARAVAQMVDGRMVLHRSDDEGDPCDWWVYADVEIALITAAAKVGFEKPDFLPTTYDALHPGTWKQGPRLDDMTTDGVSASMCYPNLVPRFCGQTFLERGDRETSLECVRSYNDWMIDEWCGGAGHGRLLPLTLIPLWDVNLAVAELQRCAEKGTVAVAFSENPYQLGLPSLHSGYWDPFFQTAADTETTVCMHIGSSSHMPTTSPDAPHIISSLTHFSVSAGSLLDFIFSGTLDRIPNLKLFFAESQAGWLPFVLEQADALWALREGSSMSVDLPNPPTSYLVDRVFTSIFHDDVAIKNRDSIGVRQMCFETDYPHSVTTFPESHSGAMESCRKFGLDDGEIYELMRGSAIRAFGLERLGITS